MNITCSNCGSSQRLRYSASAVLAVCHSGWNSCGSALYCPECSATWDKRNPGRPMAGKENTVRVIDGIHRMRNWRDTP